MPIVRLPDGATREFSAPVTVADVAAAIGPGLAKAAVAGRVAGRLVDLSHLIAEDTDVAIVTTRDAEGLEIIRHSTAHLLAYAVKELFPEAQVTIGPVIDNGFYYDFSYKRPFTPEDLTAIEVRMSELANRDFAVRREVWKRDEAVAFFRSIGEQYKAEIIASIPSNEDISLYREGDFIDLCRGPHVPSTGRLKVFKLMKVAGAYWRGDARNEMLQRIYGTAWATKADQDAYLHMLEEAEKRDHRKLGRQLDLFHVQEEAPGMVFWHPHGWTLWQQVEQYMRRMLSAHGYREVRTPMVMDRALWERSGHWENYREHMFTTASENRDYAVKPMNCPGHVQIFNQGLRSYRDLPLRLAVTATSPPGPSTGSCGCVPSPRTMPTSSAVKIRSRMRRPASSTCCGASTPISALKRSSSSSPPGRRSASVPTTPGIVPSRRSVPPWTPRAWPGNSTRARAPSTGRRSSSR
jgi:threonyl-tRNA synthetase